MAELVEIKGAKELSLALDRLADGISQPRALLNILGARMKSQIAETFRLARDPMTGAPWKTPAPLRIGGDGASGGSLKSAGARTLEDTRRLLRSYVSAAPVITSDSVAVRTNVVYARIHQEGGVIRPKKAKSLAIPLTKEAKRSGGARRWWAANEDKKPFILRTPNGAFIVTKNDVGPVQDGARKRTASAREKSFGRALANPLTFHFTLRRSVTIPQRRHLGFGPEQVAQIEADILNFLSGEFAASSAGGRRR